MATKSRQRRRPRAILGWGVIVFLIIQIASGLMLDYVWPCVRYPMLGYVLQAVPTDPEESVIVCFGSSRFQCGIDPHEISRVLANRCLIKRPCSVMNAGIPAADPIVFEHVLEQLRQAGVKPACLVVEVSPETVCRHTEWLMYHARCYLRIDQLPPFCVELCRQGHALRILALRCFPLFYYRHEVLSGLHLASADENFWESRRPRYSRIEGQTQPLSYQTDPDTGLLQLPSRPVTPALQQEIEQKLAHQLPRRWLDHYQIQGSNSAALERILKRCSQYSIPVVLIGIPVTSTQRRRYDDEIQKPYQQFLDKLCSDYGCTFIEGRDWLPDGFFFDNHHMTDEGKTYFSRMLALRVLAPRWPKQQTTGTGRQPEEMSGHGNE